MIKRKLKEKILPYFCLHILLIFLSLSGIFSKMAGEQEFLSFKFCLFYGLVILILGVYAIAWQQILKRIPLVTAYANKAVNVIWGLIWGYLLFEESITLPKLLGSLIIISGVLVVVTEKEEK